MSTQSTSGGLSLAKKTAQFAGGWFLILYPLVINPPDSYGTFHLVVIAMGGALAGVPGVATVLERWSIGGAAPSSPSPPAASPPPAGPSSPSPSGSVAN